MNNWTQYRIKDIARFISTKTDDPMLPYIALDNIISWEAKFVSSESTSDGNSIECESGDVLFGKLRPYLAKGFIPKEKSCCSSEFIVLRPENNVCNKFLLYYLLSKTFISYIKNLATGVKMPRTNWSQIGGSVISMPPLKQQEAIATYLDKECEKIGRRIALLERKADAYRRLRRSLINRAVTRGLNNPAWMTSRIKDIFVIIGGNGFKEEFQGSTSGDYPFVKTSDINSQSMYLDTAANYVTNDVAQSEGYNIIPKGSIICSKIGAALKLNHRKLSACEVIIDNNLQAFYPRDGYDSRYYYYVLSLLDMSMFDNLGAIPCVNNRLLRNYHLQVPPIEEQKEIVAYLDEKCAKIDAIVEKINIQIERLKELKRSLINEVVTGKCAIN